METFPKKITEFLKKHHVVTIATCESNQAWCFNAFYVFDEENQSLIITSHEDTKHIQQVRHNTIVAGSVVLETEMVGKVQGLQFVARMTQCDGDEEKRAGKLYTKRFPFATLVPKVLWTISLSEAKYTDNTLGFGKKLLWTRED